MNIKQFEETLDMLLIDNSAYQTNCTYEYAVQVKSKTGFNPENTYALQFVLYSNIKEAIFQFSLVEANLDVLLINAINIIQMRNKNKLIDMVSY